MNQFHSLMVSQNISITAEGYLICVNVPICRSGYQEYRGSELTSFPGFEKSWKLEPDKLYKVYRPKEEVLSPETIHSFEGKTVVDTHPSNEGNVVTIENERYLNCGHIQNVRQGPDQDGEVTLIGNIIIKDPALKEKVFPIINEDAEPVRDVSCGYTLKLKRLNDGTLVMYHLRGNHVAVVEKGRAGPRIAIKDSAPPPIQPKKERTKMSLWDRIRGAGLKAVLADASPEEAAEIAKDMAKEKEPHAEVDSKPKLEASAVDKDPHRAAAHAALDRALDAVRHEKGMGVDAHGKPANIKSLRKQVNDFLGEDEKEPERQADGVEELKEKSAGDAKHVKGCQCDSCKSGDTAAGDEEEHQDEKTPAEEHDKMGAADAGGRAEKEIDDPGASVLKAANDSVIDYIRSSKPLVAVIAAKPRSQRSSQEQLALDSYNGAVRKVNSIGGVSAYTKLTKVKTPEKIQAIVTDSAAASGATVATEDCSRFYEGVPYAIGKKRHQEYLDRKGNK